MAPILTVLILLLLRVRSLLAGAVGLLVALAGTVLVYPMAPEAVLDAIVNMGPTVLEVAIILLGGMGLAELMARSGAQDSIAGWLGRAEHGGDRLATLLLLVYGLTPFMESVTGYGLGVVITAPLLIRHGLSAIRAVMVGLLGLVLVPWGSLGPGTLVAATLGGEELTALGMWTAILTAPVLVVSMVGVFAIAVGRPNLRQAMLGILVLVVQWLSLILANAWLGIPLAGVISAAAVMLVLLAVIRLRSGPLPTIDAELYRAIMPYIVLVVGIFAATMITTVLDASQQWGWTTSPAIWAIISSGVAFPLLQLPRTQWAETVGTIMRGWGPVAANAVVFLVLGITMSTSGMAEHLAVAAAGIGPFFVAMVPAIGAIGGYLTGSNVGAAAMFSTATTTASTSLGANSVLVLASQNVAGSFAIITSPPRVALAVGVALPYGQQLPRTATVRLVMSVLASVLILGVLVGVLA